MTYARTHFGSTIASEKTGFCGDDMSPGSMIRVRTTASIGARSSASLQHLAEIGRLGFAGLQPGLVLGDLFFSRAGQLQVQRLLIHGQLGFGHVERGPGIFEILLARGSFGGQAI